jgi:CheY-like chemotaxis protein
VEISDSGVGIAPEMLPRIFELFVQADPAGLHSHGGLGIGLTLARNLVEMHGGTLEAGSAGIGSGSTFTVRLPLASGAPPQVAQNEAPAASGKKQLRLLVVDDNKDAATTLATLLQLRGHEVLIAHDGKTALDVASTYRPELIFLDLGMPGMDGFEVARTIKSTPELRGTCIAALTGWGQPEDRRKAREAGCDHHLVKPPDAGAVDGLLGALM